MSGGPPMDAWMVFERIGVIPAILVFIVWRLERRLQDLTLLTAQVLSAVRELVRRTADQST